MEKKSTVKWSFLGVTKGNLEAFGEMEEEMIQYRNRSIYSGATWNTTTEGQRCLLRDLLMLLNVFGFL